MDTNMARQDVLITPLKSFSAKCSYGSTFCKRPIEIQILVKDDIITDIGASSECIYSQICLNTIRNMAIGNDINLAWNITGDDVKENMKNDVGESDCMECDTYAVAAFKLALRNYEKGV